MELLDAVSAFIHRNLIFCLALSIVPIKLLMLRLVTDNASQRDALLATPEDLGYVVIGLVLSSAPGNTGVLTGLERSVHPQLNMLLLLILSVVVTLFIHWIGSHTKLQYMSWQAANALEQTRSAEDESTGVLPLVYATSETSANLKHLSLHHFAAFLFTLCIQCVVLFFWIKWVGSLMHSS